MTTDKLRTGYCIKTKEVIGYNPERPYSRNAYNVWTTSGSKTNYEEKYCHKCGKANRSSVARPVCYNFFKE